MFRLKLDEREAHLQILVFPGNNFTHEIIQRKCNFAARRSISNVTKKEMRIAAYLPEARRETRGRARVLPANAES